MERITTLLSDPIWIGAILTVTVAIAAAALAVAWLVAPPADAVAARLERAVAAATAGGEGGAGPVASALRDDTGKGSTLHRVLRALGVALGPRKEDAEAGQVRGRLIHAGFRGPHAVEVLFGAKAVLSLLLAGAVLVFASIYARPLPYKYAFVAAAAAIGFYAPNVWVQRRAAERQLQIVRALPDTLDLLVVCVEAGLGVESAIARVVDQIGLSSPVLAKELSQTMLEVRAGMPRGEAFRRLAARTGVEDLRSLAATLVQTELFGTSVARALRVQAESLRSRRTQRAEERAATAAARMVIPLVLCILPALFVVIVGPAAIRVAKVLMPVLEGG